MAFDFTRMMQRPLSIPNWSKGVIRLFRSFAHQDRGQCLPHVTWNVDMFLITGREDDKSASGGIRETSGGQD
jgi:hypothetical protein